MKRLLLILALCCVGWTTASGQPWAGILAPTYGAGACTLTPSSGYAGCGIDWTQSGVPGGIPSGSWAQCVAGACAIANSAGTGATVAQINAALTACSTAGSEYVLLASGTYTFTTDTSITIPSNCELRGAGANLTILKWPVGGITVPYIVLGSTTEITATSNAPTNVTGSAAGSTSMTLASTTNVVAGTGLMLVTELNNANLVAIGSSQGSASGSCTFCYIAYAWGPADITSSARGSARVRGQLVHVNTVNTGTGVVTFDPPLFTDYGDMLPAWTATKYYSLYSFISAGSHYYEQTATGGSLTYCLSGGTTPPFSTSGGSVTDGTCTWLDEGAGTSAQAQVIAFPASATYAGVSNLQIYDQDGASGNNAPAGVDIYKGGCLYCWVNGVEVNYTTADWTFTDQSFRNTIQNSYFSNSFSHTSGSYDSTNGFFSGTTGELFVNNICERGHIGCVDPERGAAGNVFAYNYSTGPFDTGGGVVDYWIVPSFDYHGAHPDFNLTEGNVWANEHADAVWGSASHHTSFRNWLYGTNRIANPSTNPTARAAVDCTSLGYPGQAGTDCWYAYQQNSPIRIDFASSYFNLVGDILGSAQVGTTAFPILLTSGNTQVAISDQCVAGTCAVTGYGSNWYGETLGLGNTSDNTTGNGTNAVDNSKPFTSSLFHGVYQNADGSTTWQSPITHTLPASFFLASKPSWWGSTIPWPSIGPDLSTGSAMAGHVHSSTAANPAQACFALIGGVDGGAGSPLAFNAATCYATASGQLWSGVLDPSRGITWTAGAGTIPTGRAACTTTQCINLANGTAPVTFCTGTSCNTCLTASLSGCGSVQAALNSACGPGSSIVQCTSVTAEVVSMPTATTTLNQAAGGILQMPPWVTLTGQGPKNTIIKLGNGGGVGGPGCYEGGVICVGYDTGGYAYDHYSNSTTGVGGGGNNYGTWTASSYIQGSNVIDITVSGGAAPQTGDVLILFENDIATDPGIGHLYPCGGSILLYQDAGYGCSVEQEASQSGPGVSSMQTATYTTWSSVTAYTEGELVTENGIIYICTTPNTNEMPPNSTYWSVYSSGGSFSGTGTCNLSSFNNGATGATGTIAVNSNTPGAIIITNSGLATTSAPTTATLSNGTATCSGTVTISVPLQIQTTNAETQTVQITNVTTGGSCPGGMYCVTFTPGLYLPNWQLSQSPGAFWSTNPAYTGSVVENFTLDCSACSDGGNRGALINYNWTTEDWTLGMRLLNNGSVPYRNTAWVTQSDHITFESNYVYGSDGSSEGYGFENSFETSDNLIDNNIFQHVAASEMSESGGGSVFAYNYSVDNYYTGAGANDPSWQAADQYANHQATPYFNLWESNVGQKVTGDIIHGGSFLNVVYRSYAKGIEGPFKFQNTAVVDLEAYNRYYSIINSVLGTLNYHTNYKAVPALNSSCTANNTPYSCCTGSGTGTCVPRTDSSQCSSTIPTLSIYNLGFGGSNGCYSCAGSNCPGSNGNPFNDVTSGSYFTLQNSTYLWANYDVVHGSTQYNSAEVPGVIAGFPQSVPSSICSSSNPTCPPSFFYSSKPSWYGVTGQAAIPWPAIGGSDVTGGNIPNTGGHANQIPAQLNFNTMAFDTNYTGTQPTITSIIPVNLNYYYCQPPLTLSNSQCYKATLSSIPSSFNTCVSDPAGQCYNTFWILGSTGAVFDGIQQLAYVCNNSGGCTIPDCGSEPCVGTYPYTQAPFPLSNNQILFAAAPGLSCTTCGTATVNAIRVFDPTVYAATTSATVNPTFSPPAGTYSSAQTVTVSSTTPSAFICTNTTGSTMSTDGGTLCTNGTHYTGPVTVSSSETLYAIAGATGLTDSSQVSAAYTTASGQPWATFLDPSRATRWDTNGVGATITNRTTACATQPTGMSTGGTAAANSSAIQTAIVAANGGNCVINLPAGTYNWNGNVTNNYSGFTIRGNGTTLVAASGAGYCGGGNGGNLVIGDCNSGGWYVGSAAVQPGGANAATVNSGYTQGSTSIVVGSIGSSGISVGQLIVMDQANLTTDNGGIYTCDQVTTPQYCHESGQTSSDNGRTIGGIDYNGTQMFVVTAVTGSGATRTLTLSNPIYGNNWASGQTPGIWWPSTVVSSEPSVYNIGVENITFDYTANSSVPAGINFYDCYNCWATGIQSKNANRNHVWVYQSKNVTIADSYFFGTQNTASESYGVEDFISSDSLVQNTIFQQVAEPLIGGGSSGWVEAYNFWINNRYGVVTNWNESAFMGHDAGNSFKLLEGNEGNTILQDDIHGIGGGSNTVFRNQLSGRGYNCTVTSGTCTATALTTNNTSAINIYYGARGHNVIGNVLGTASYHTTYQTDTTGSSANCNASIFVLGWGAATCTVDGGGVNYPQKDTLVESTLMRWDNYDVATNAVRQFTPEGCPGAGTYLNANCTNFTTPSTTIPASLYLSAKPSWWNFPGGSASPFPAVGPDVTGGTITAGTGPNATLGGHAYPNPAMNMYFKVMSGPTDGSGTMLTGFNPALYYTSSTAANPTFSPPAGTYSSAQTVVISSATPSAFICYNTTGSAMSTASGTSCTNGTHYTGPVTVPSSETLYAIAGATGFTDSSQVPAAYSIGAPTNLHTKIGVPSSGSSTIGTAFSSLTCTNDVCLPDYQAQGGTPLQLPQGFNPLGWYNQANAVSIFIGTTINGCPKAPARTNPLNNILSSTQCDYYSPDLTAFQSVVYDWSTNGAPAWNVYVTHGSHFDSYLNGSNSSPWVWQDAVTISNNGFVTGGANNFIVFDSDCQPPGSVTSYKINGVYTPLGPCTDINNKPNTNDLGYNPVSRQVCSHGGDGEDPLYGGGPVNPPMPNMGWRNPGCSGSVLGTTSVNPYSVPVQPSYYPCSGGGGTYGANMTANSSIPCPTVGTYDDLANMWEISSASAGVFQSNNIGSVIQVGLTISPITSFTGSGSPPYSGTLTFTTNSAVTGNNFNNSNNFSVGEKVTLNGFPVPTSTSPLVPTNSGLNGQTVTVLATGLNSTQFEATVTGTYSGNSSCTAKGLPNSCCSGNGIGSCNTGTVSPWDATTNCPGSGQGSTANGCPVDGVNHIVIRNAKIHPDSAAGAAATFLDVTPVDIEPADWLYFSNVNPLLPLVSGYLAAAPHDIYFFNDYFTGDYDDNGFGLAENSAGLHLSCTRCGVVSSYHDGASRNGEGHMVDLGPPGPHIIANNYIESDTIQLWEGGGGNAATFSVTGNGTSQPLIPPNTIPQLTANSLIVRNNFTYNSRWAPSPAGLNVIGVGIKGFTCNSGTLTLPLNTSGPVGVAYTDNTQGIYNSVVYVGGFNTSANNAMSLVAGTNPQWYAAYSNTTTGAICGDNTPGGSCGPGNSTVNTVIIPSTGCTDGVNSLAITTPGKNQNQGTWTLTVSSGNASATATVGVNGTVTSVNLTQGSGYTTAPTFTMPSGACTGTCTLATFTASLIASSPILYGFGSCVGVPTEVPPPWPSNICANPNFKITSTMEMPIVVNLAQLNQLSCGNSAYNTFEAVCSPWNQNTSFKNNVEGKEGYNRWEDANIYGPSIHWAQEGQFHSDSIRATSGMSKSVGGQTTNIYNDTISNAVMRHSDEGMLHDAKSGANEFQCSGSGPSQTNPCLSIDTGQAVPATLTSITCGYTTIPTITKIVSDGGNCSAGANCWTISSATAQIIGANIPVAISGASNSAFNGTWTIQQSPTPNGSTFDIVVVNPSNYSCTTQLSCGNPANVWLGTSTSASPTINFNFSSVSLAGAENGLTTGSDVYVWGITDATLKTLLPDGWYQTANVTNGNSTIPVYLPNGGTCSNPGSYTAVGNLAYPKYASSNGGGISPGMFNVANSNIIMYDVGNHQLYNSSGAVVSLTMSSSGHNYSAILQYSGTNSLQNTHCTSNTVNGVANVTNGNPNTGTIDVGTVCVYITAIDECPAATPAYGNLNPTADCPLFLQAKVGDLINIECPYTSGANTSCSSLATDAYNSPGTTWSSVTAYTEGELVTENGIIYICTTPNTNEMPPNSTYWSVALSSNNTGQPQLLGLPIVDLDSCLNPTPGSGYCNIADAAAPPGFQSWLTYQPSCGASCSAGNGPAGHSYSTVTDPLFAAPLPSNGALPMEPPMTASWKNVPAGVNSLGIPATDDFGSSGLWLGDSYPKYTTFQHMASYGMNGSYVYGGSFEDNLTLRAGMLMTPGTGAPGVPTGNTGECSNSTNGCVAELLDNWGRQLNQVTSIRYGFAFGVGSPQLDSFTGNGCGHTTPPFDVSGITNMGNPHTLNFNSYVVNNGSSPSNHILTNYPLWKGSTVPNESSLWPVVNNQSSVSLGCNSSSSTYTINGSPHVAGLNTIPPRASSTGSTVTCSNSNGQPQPCSTNNFSPDSIGLLGSMNQGNSQPSYPLALPDWRLYAVSCNGLYGTFNAPGITCNGTAANSINDPGSPYNASGIFAVTDYDGVQRDSGPIIPFIINARARTKVDCPLKAGCPTYYHVTPQYEWLTWKVCNNGCTGYSVYMDNLPPSGSPVLTITDPTIGYAQIYDIWPIGSVHTWAVYDSTNTAVTGTCNSSGAPTYPNTSGIGNFLCHTTY